MIDIEGIEEKPDEYEERIQEDIRNTLKKEGGDGRRAACKDCRFSAAFTLSVPVPAR